MMSRIQRYSVLFLLSLLWGCAPAISLQTGADPSLSFKEVAQNPNAYEGRTVLWGGEIIDVLPQENGRNLFEVLEWPLGWREKPRRTVPYQGKFLVLLEGPLEDPSLYRSGTRITVAGEVQGSISGKEVKSVSDPAYHYPLLLSKEVHVWKHRPYPYSSGPDDRETREYRQSEGILRY